MNSIINLKVRSGYFKPIINVNSDCDTDTINIDLYVPSNRDFLSIIKDDYLKELLYSELKVFGEYKNSGNDMFNYLIELINKLLEIEEPITNTITEICLEPNKETADYIKNNPIIRNFPLTLDGGFTTNNGDLAKIDNYFYNLDNLKLYMDGNHEMVSITEYINTIKAINDLVNIISKYNLSPIEQVMYAYDITRARVYLEEDSHDDYYTSRDLSQVLKGDKIVCVGFANILDKVLKNLGFTTEMVSLFDIAKLNGHMRNIIYINDNKYNIEGVYYLDATWDSKKSTADMTYLNSYNFFCLTKEQIDNLSCKYKHNYLNKKYDAFKNSTVKEVEYAFNEGLEIPKNVINTINNISNFIDGYDLFDPIILPEYIKSNFTNQDILDKLNYYNALIYESKITKDEFLKILLNVRKVEYYENPEYPYSIADIKKISRTIELTDEQAKDIEQVRLTKVLRKIYEKN